MNILLTGVGASVPPDEDGDRGLQAQAHKRQEEYIFFLGGGGLSYQ